MSKKGARTQNVQNQNKLPDPITITKSHHTSVMEEVEGFPLDIKTLSTGEVILEGSVNGGFSPFTISLTDLKKWLLDHNVQV